MTYPSPYVQVYSYTAFQQSQGDNAFPGTLMDTDLAEVATAIQGLTTFVQAALRSDGTLQNGSVTLEKLSSDIQIGVPVPTVWAAATAYAANATVTDGPSLYIALAAHTSGSSFATDLANGLWRLVVTFSTSSVAPANSVSSSALVDGAVTTTKLADGAVTGAKIADGTISSAKFTASLGAVPIGGVLTYDGVDLPTGFRWCDGTAVSRTTYAALFSAISKVVTAASSTGSDTLTSVSLDVSALGLVGATVEHAGFPAGVTILSVTSTTIRLSAAATSSLTASARILPHGAGDGSTTFNVPDRRGRSDIGRDDMGGAAASRLTTLAGIGSTGGEEKHALSIGELAAHSHGVTDAGHSHGVTDPGHKHLIGKLITTAYAAGFGPTFNPTPLSDYTSTTTTGVTVNSASTGVTVNSAGSGTAHNNLQPSYVCNKIIFAGA